jgi:hypothetical protein
MEMRAKKELPLYTRVGRGVVWWTHPVRPMETVHTGRRVRLKNLAGRGRTQNFVEVKVGVRQKHFALAADVRKYCERWIRRTQRPARERN